MHIYRQESVRSGKKHSFITFHYIFSLVHLIKRLSHLVNVFCVVLLNTAFQTLLLKHMAVLQFTADGVIKSSRNSTVTLWGWGKSCEKVDCSNTKFINSIYSMLKNMNYDENIDSRLCFSEIPRESLLPCFGG